MFWPCETRTSTCLSFATISSGLYRFLAIAVLLDVKDIPQVGPLQWGWINVAVVETFAAPPRRIATARASQEPVATVGVMDHLDRAARTADHRGLDHHRGLAFGFLKCGPPGSPH